MLEPKKHYVYAAIHQGQVVYIGRGKGGRWRHCTSGISSSYYLNKLHFEGETVEVLILQDGLSNQNSEALEGYLIGRHRPVANSVGKYSCTSVFVEHMDKENIDYKKHHTIVKGFVFQT